MKREQIVELVKNHADGIWNKNDNPNQPMADEVDIMELADAILALPLDVPTDDDAGIIAVKIASTVEPKLTAQEEAMFVAGFQECVKYLRMQGKGN